jgi:hypothetical protein
MVVRDVIRVEVRRSVSGDGRGLLANGLGVFSSCKGGKGEGEYTSEVAQQ